MLLTGEKLKMEEIKTLKLLARMDINGSVKVDREQSENLSILESIGIYEFIKLQNKGKNANAFALNVSISEKGLMIRQKGVISPECKEFFDICDLFENLKDKEIKRIKKKLEIENER